MNTSPGSNDNLPEVSEQGVGPRFTPANGEEQRTHDDILRVLADFQAGLQSLKSLHAQRESLQAELLAQREELSARERVFADEREALEAKLAARGEELLAKDREFEAQRERFERDRAALARQDEESRAAVQEASASEREARRVEREELEKRCEELELRASAGENHAMELERERGHAEELQRALSMAQGALASEKARREELEQRCEQLGTLTAQHEKRAGELVPKLAQASSEIESLRADLERAKREPVKRDGGFMARRRARLAEYRRAVRRQVLKVRKASEALGKRMEQVDQLLSQRAEMAQARQRIIEAEHRLERSKAKGRAAMVTLCSVAVVAMLGALSWVLAREVAPATYVAEVTLKADGRGRDLNEAELEEWKRYHMELLGDPMFQEAASERFARQGMLKLGTPAAVSGLMTAWVHADSMAPGEIRLNLTGRGKDETRRTLEALSASVASFANAAQQRRIDGGSTVIPVPAHVDDSPVDNTQVYYALTMMGVGTALAGILAMTVWKRLSSVKSRFEHDSQVASVLDEARWADVNRG
ncbi:hypothetical protein PHYC_00961 [Phycisphaerales bacterium]|nr:hypothetical protein PHYC_00961 [Phycisphaerales bacterium]